MADPAGDPPKPQQKPQQKSTARKMREAAVAALLGADVEDRFDDALRKLDAPDPAVSDEDRLRAADLIAKTAEDAPRLEQLLGNALASAFDEAEAEALDRDVLKAIALPLLAELTRPRKAGARQLADSYAAVAAALPTPPAAEATARLLGQLGAEVGLMKSAARLAAVQALYQMEMAKQPLGKVREQFESLRIGAEIEGARYREADIDLFRRILDITVERQVAIDQLTDRTLVDRWPLGRVDATLRALFRAAGAELQAGDAPPKVVISEYVDVARAFFPDGKEPGLVNAVLDAMAREVRPEAFA